MGQAAHGLRARLAYLEMGNSRAGSVSFQATLAFHEGAGRLIPPTGKLDTTFPHCASTASSDCPNRTELGYRRFRCRDCRHMFNERTGTRSIDP
jgi:hypothetical protein